jgi:glutamine synthetase
VADKKAQICREAINKVQKLNAEMVDLKFCGFLGQWHHLTIPASRLSEKTFTEGEAFDGSAIPGFKAVESGDMVLLPDPGTLLLDPFWKVPTVSFICDIGEADTKASFGRDPRGVAGRAEQYLRRQGIADESFWLPEFEFYIFDKVSVSNDINVASYVIDSEEADWNSGIDEAQNLGHKIPRKGGYHAIPPLDHLFDLRAEMCLRIEKAGIPVKYHHHEVGGPGQSEIEILLRPLPQVGDDVMLVKYLIKNTAMEFAKTVTFMPKPLYNEAGSGMHIHHLLRKGGKNLYYDAKGYAGLSKTALHAIGGILHHGPSLLAFTNPSTNSYKRLIPGFEAPTNLFFGLANRSAAIRIPKSATSEAEKRFEFRPPDATCNFYFAVSALLMAAIDGIKRKIDPTKEGFGPFDTNVFALSPSEREKIRQLPTSLKESIQALGEDHDYLLEGGVFSEDLIRVWSHYKLEHEHSEVRNRPHPYEITLYYDV